MFLAWDFNVDELRRRGFRDKFSQVLERRRPHEISYLRELGLLLERLQDDRGALSAWERMHAAYVANDQAGTDLDAESGLHRGQILQRLGQPKAALKVLAEVPTEEPLDPVAEDALKLRCEIASSLTDAAADGLRDLMALCVERRSLRCIIALASGLRKEGRTTEALNLLIHADRTLKGDHERFTLRLEMLKVLTLADDWTPERGRSQIAALLRTTTRDRETLQDMHAWLRDQAAGRHAGGWISILATECRAGADRPLAALALSAFAGHLGGEAHEDFLEAWKKVAEQDRICIELAAEALLGADRAAWAGEACRILASVPTLREQGRKLPLAVRVAHAQKDEAAIRELFNDTLRLAFPGGAQTIEWARAFEDAGHADLAAELFAAALQRIDGSAAQQPEIFAAHARFLIRQQQFEAADTDPS
jgi:tetratricopeptide (TPR) repeat protein